MPDITYPANYDPESIGESTLDGPLPWDKITPTRYRTKSSLGQYLPELRTNHAARVSHDPEFTYVKEAFAYRRQQSQDTLVSLNEAVRRAEKAETEAFWVALENRKRIAEGLAPIESLDDLEDGEEPRVADASQPATGITPASEDPDVSKESEGSEQILSGNELAGVSATPGADEAAGQESDANEAGKKEQPDAFLVESGYILLDYISLEQRTAAGNRALNNPTETVAGKPAI